MRGNRPMVRCVLAGAVQLSATCLEALVAAGLPPVAVLALAPASAGRHADYCDLADRCRPHGIPAHSVSDLNAPGTIALLRGYAPDYLLVWGWSQLVKPAVLALPRCGCLGLHPALLPRHRGRHPLIWPLVLGESESGLTIFFLDAGADSGDIIVQRAFPILLDDTATTIYARVSDLTRTLVAWLAPRLRAGTVPRTPQEHRLADYLRRRTEKDGEIFWGQPALQVHNLIRGLTHPYVGAHTSAAGKRISVWRSRWTAAEAGTGRPGTILGRDGDDYLVACLDRPLRVADCTGGDGQPLTFAPGTVLGLPA